MADTIPAVPTTTITRLPDSNPHSCDVLRTILPTEQLSERLPNRCLTKPAPGPVAANEPAWSAAQKLHEIDYNREVIYLPTSCGSILQGRSMPWALQYVTK